MTYSLRQLFHLKWGLLVRCLLGSMGKLSRVHGSVITKRDCFVCYAVPNKIYVLEEIRKSFLSVSVQLPIILSFPANIDSCIRITVHLISTGAARYKSSSFNSFLSFRSSCRFLNWDTTYRYEPVSYRHVLICRKENQ